MAGLLQDMVCADLVALQLLQNLASEGIVPDLGDQVRVHAQPGHACQGIGAVPATVVLHPR